MTLTGTRCLVLGAGGFIGTNLLAALTATGAVTTAFGRLPRDLEVPLGVRWMEGEFADAERMAMAVREQDVVFHLLGGSIPAESNNEPSADVIGSLLPSIRLIEACRAAGIGRLVFASSGGTVYGPGPHRPVAEDEPTNPITAYGINKLAVEKYLGLFRRLHGLSPVVLRVANPYGPHQDVRRPQGIVATAIAHALAGEDIVVWGDGSVVRDYLHIDDVVRALLAAVRYRGDEWIFNVGSGEGRSVAQVVESVRSLTGLAADRVRYRPARPVDTPYNVLDTGLIGREMGWRPQVAFEQGLADTIRWWRTRA
jgi:UDP-glucose 4-epimerase